MTRKFYALLKTTSQNAKLFTKVATEDDRGTDDSPERDAWFDDAVEAMQDLHDSLHQLIAEAKDPSPRSDSDPS